MSFYCINKKVDIFSLIWLKYRCVYLAKETKRATVTCFIVEVFSIKLFIITHLLIISQMTLLKVEHFSYLSCQIGYFLRKFKMLKKSDGAGIKHLTLRKPVINFLFNFFFTFLCKPKCLKWRKYIFLKFDWTKINHE